MKSNLTWIKNFQTVVDNGRTHTMVMDLPPGKDGDDTGPTALEVLVMSLTGCIGTIYALVAKKMRIDIEELEVKLEADKGPDDPTITAVRAEVIVKADASEKKLERCLETTMNTCPVGVLYTQAGVDVKTSLTKL
ncbi:MAG: OsmC family protein [Asgard group archaeon]|nr:OsmC family protein [Asgard group archaeon]